MSKQLNKFFIFFFTSSVLLIACSKETSFETGNPFGIAEGTLKDSIGNCQGIVLNGNYAVDTVLTDANYVTVTATIATAGKYKIYSDTVNGFWFRDSAYVLTAGVQTFKLKGFGKPILPIASTFTIVFNTSSCLFNITPTGAGGSGNVTPASGEYFPTTTNSNWTYSNSGLADTVRYTCTNFTTTVNSNSYRLFVSSRGDSLLYRKDSLQGNYYQYVTYTGDPGSSGSLEYKFLDDKLPLNSFWESVEFSIKINGQNYTFKIRFTIDDKNSSYTINGITFNNVIKVKEQTLQKDAGGLFSINNSSTEYFYYAKKIGIIWSDFPNGSLPYSEKITRSQIF